jgi:hypothetical protein
LQTAIWSVFQAIQRQMSLCTLCTLQEYFLFRNLPCRQQFGLCFKPYSARCHCVHCVHYKNISCLGICPADRIWSVFQAIQRQMSLCTLCTLQEYFLFRNLPCRQQYGLCFKPNMARCHCVHCVPVHYKNNSCLGICPADSDMVCVPRQNMARCHCVHCIH